MYYFENGELNPEIINMGGTSNCPSLGVFKGHKCKKTTERFKKLKEYDPSFDVKSKKCQGYAGNGTDMLEVSNCLTSDMPDDVRRLCVCQKDCK